MNGIKQIFKSNEEYKAIVKQMKPIDSMLAIAVYVMVIVLYYIMGLVFSRTNQYFGNQVNFLLAFLCIACVFLRKQSFKTIGFSKRYLFKSIRLGLIPSGILLIIIIIIGFLNGLQLQPASRLLNNFLYYFFTISFVEEIIFRGFIQTRIYGLIKKPMVAIIVTALMFMSIHIPYQMAEAGMGAIEFILNNYVTLILTFMWHLIFNFMYIKYNNIIAGTIFHAFVNWCNYIFI
jgi:membrane protease YdiL (CAAX protease family)